MPLRDDIRRGQPPETGPWRDRFGGKLVLVLLDNKYTPAVKQGRSLWGIQRDLTFRTVEDDLITVPAGFVTDLASIPRWCWTVLPPDGPWVKAAIVHDYLYATAGTGVWKRRSDGRSCPEPYSRSEADGIFRDALENRGVASVKRFILWLAVRVGGSRGWGQDDSRQRATDADEAFVLE